MIPLSEAVLELRLVVAQAEDLAPGLCASHGHLEDFRTETYAHLMDALDRVDPGLGTRLLLALYPHADAQRAHA